MLKYFQYLVSQPLVKLAKFMTKESGNIESIYYFLQRLGILWVTFMRVLVLLNIDRIIFAPVGQNLVPLPLFLSSSERNVVDIFKPNTGDIVVDVGTYYGRYTLMASGYVGSTGLVLGIEADLKNYCITKRNIENNKIRNVLLFHLAASNHEGTIKLYKTETPGTHSICWNTISKYDIVPSKTIDSLIDQLSLKRVDWIKIDVEGAELMVLEGSHRTFERNKNLKLVIEIHTGDNNVFQFLKKRGFKITFLENNQKIPYHILAIKD